MEPKSPEKKQEEVKGLDAEVTDPIVKLKSQDGGTFAICCTVCDDLCPL